MKRCRLIAALKFCGHVTSWTLFDTKVCRPGELAYKAVLTSTSLLPDRSTTCLANLKSNIRQKSCVGI